MSGAKGWWWRHVRLCEIEGHRALEASGALRDQWKQRDERRASHSRTSVATVNSGTSVTSVTVVASTARVP